MKAVVLTRGRIATVDDEDFERVNAHKWHATSRGTRHYGIRYFKLPSGKKVPQLLHSFITGLVGVDHKNGDGTDCRKDNMRPATEAENSRGFQSKKAGATSRFRGVSWDTRCQKWLAQVMVNREQIFLGRYVNEIDAARAYNAGALKHFGEFASPNPV